MKTGKLYIRVSSYTEITDIIKVCEAIQIIGKIAEDDDWYEYLQPMTFVCERCYITHTIYILIG